MKTDTLVTNVGDDGRWRTVQTITIGLGTYDTREEAEIAAVAGDRNIASALVAEERVGQATREGYYWPHDDSHDDEELAQAAAAYVLADQALWPWPDGWKPSPGDRVRQLVKAGALIVAEIDRLRRQDGEG